ncbi:2-oxoisovalerate dehydrogenase alpha subunit, mitochondrial precursor [Purpureocillium lavendulum]|uniref:2-oxoisovalerate dehydrogenase alpha subunit, mitochondrial n=1 Tax=Purpureocillium lavendulum TaxID=1247861 RepID=A0AB34FII5_9HYPO|nr:2-oxoisovalerate dehydrogenase alpha subunit, mitochondrial precursor [Purpureocillium lavendulum]
MSAQDSAIPDSKLVHYSIDLSKHPEVCSDPEASRYIAVYKVDVIFINIDFTSDFRIMRTGTNDTVHEAVAQVSRHIAQGLYRIVSLNASNHSCVVVMSTDKSREDLVWKKGFPWDTEQHPQQAKLES